MITQKKITIPIFNYKLTIVIFDKWKECDKFLPADEMETEANAITIHNYGASLVAVNIEQRVIESAIVFWFKDADCKSENKIVEYFREH